MRPILFKVILIRYDYIITIVTKLYIVIYQRYNLKECEQVYKIDPFANFDDT